MLNSVAKSNGRMRENSLNISRVSEILFFAPPPSLPKFRPDAPGRTVVVGAGVVVVVVGISVSNSSPRYVAQQWRKARMHSQDSVM